MGFRLGSRARRGGFTLVELMIVIAIVILLLAILLPTLSSMQSDRRQAVCANNLRNLGLGLAAASRAGEPLDSTNWSDAILPFIGEEADLLYCPEHGTSAISYGMNNHAHRFGDEDAHRIALLDYDTTEAEIVVRDIAQQDSWAPTGGRYAARHTDQINVLLHSGSVQRRSPESIDPRVTETWLGNWRPHRDDFVIGGAVEKAPSSSLVAANSEDEPSEPPQAGTPPQHEPDYPPLDPDNYCTYKSFIGLDDGEGDADPNRRFFTVYDDPEANDHRGVEIIEMFGQVFEFPFVTPLPFLSRNVYDAVGRSHTQAWGHQTRDTKAVYEFSGLEEGKYNVWVAWHADPNNATATPHTIYDGGLSEGGVEVYSQTLNQELANRDAGESRAFVNEAGDEVWYTQVGTGHQVDSGTLRLEITADTGAMHPSDEEPFEEQYSHVYEAQQSLAIADAVRITCAPDPNYASGRCVNEPPQTLDNDDENVIVTDGWKDQLDADSHNGSHLEVEGSWGSGESVTYSFPNTLSGEYRVWMRWKPDSSLATDVPVSIYEDGVLLRTVQVDQSAEILGADLDGNGERWHSIGDVEVRHGGLNVVVSASGASGTVVADGVRVQCAYGGPGDCDNSVYGRRCRRDEAPDEAMSEESEEAVKNGLAWLAKHQLPNGSWNYDHTQGTGEHILESPDPCGGRCDEVGNLPAFRVAATGMALLPFLGAGIGPTDETYGQVVEAGIQYLLTEGGALENEGELDSGPDAWVWHNGVTYMQGYEQGIAGTALLEALGTCRQSGFGDINESDLTTCCRLVARRIADCQSGSTGGWRYWCAGDQDTTVTAWNVQALLAAKAVGIDGILTDNWQTAITKARDYLDRVAVGDKVPDATYGSYATDYRYQIEQYWYGGKHYVSYMHGVLGSPLQAAGLQQLADDLAGDGPEGSSYRKFYSHYFLRKSGGSRWDAWNEAMQEYLIAEQGTDPSDHTYGSWSTGGRISRDCGRLWDTVSALLRLEVYYRDSTIGENRIYPAGVLSGDVDGDGDVDVADIMVAFENFTGPNPAAPSPIFTKTAAQGDVEPAGGDGDIDVSDIIHMFSNYTGPGETSRQERGPR